MEINKKYTGDFPINFESEDDKKRLVEILTSTFKLNGVKYLDGDICISSEYVNNYLFLGALARMISAGDANLVITGDKSKNAEYLIRLFNND